MAWRCGCYHPGLTSWLLGLWLLSCGVAAAPSAQRIQSELAQLIQGSSIEELSRYYANQGYPLIWLEGSRGSQKIDQLLGVIRSSGKDGLTAATYAPDDLERQAAAADSAEELARLEAAASLTALRLATELQAGRLSPRAIDPELFIQPREVESTAVLNAVRRSADLSALFQDWAPASDLYRQLRTQLTRYRRIQALGGWPPIATGPPILPGSSDDRVKAIRQRLAAEGYEPLPRTNTPELYDHPLQKAITAFQARHGLVPDGVIGPQTFTQLGVTVERRIRQIELSMERLRWMPDELGPTHIWINVAAFELTLVRDGHPHLTMPVAVGRPYRRTPVFSGAMSYLEFSPTWTVPPTILRQDLLPKLKRDPSSLTAQGFRVLRDTPDGVQVLDPVSIDWHQLNESGFRYRLQQAPGPRNPLGRVKFMLPNEHAIYLHDTPDKSIFDKADRTASSGCIRLAQAGALAEAVLADQPGWEPIRVQRAMAEPRTQRVRLATPIPVHFTYLTAWVDERGVAQFRRDIYARDARLERALFPRE